MQNNFYNFFSGLDAIGLSVITILAFMSMMCWSFIIYKLFLHFSIRSNSNIFLNKFWHMYGYDEIKNHIANEASSHHFSRVAKYAFETTSHFDKYKQQSQNCEISMDDFLTKSIKYSIDAERLKLESGMSIFASIASTAPFIGLFGSVYGIYETLLAIGTSGQCTLDKIAGPIGESLIMTACGLAVAIPAVLAYNIFNNQNRDVMHALDSFAYSLYSLLTTGGYPKRVVH
jgi:biopolymer transport protein ExbB